MNRETLKENLRIALLLALIFVTVATPIIAVAYWIYSTPVDVTVDEYILTLTPQSQTVPKYHYANFTATLTLNGETLDGETIYLLYANGTSTGVYELTNSTGQAVLQWNATINASFKASYQTP